MANDNDDNVSISFAAAQQAREELRRGKRSVLREKSSVPQDAAPFTRDYALHKLKNEHIAQLRQAAHDNGYGNEPRVLDGVLNKALTFIRTRTDLKVDALSPEELIKNVSLVLRVKAGKKEDLGIFNPSTVYPH